MCVYVGKFKLVIHVYNRQGTVKKSSQRQQKVSRKGGGGGGGRNIFVGRGQGHHKLITWSVYSQFVVDQLASYTFFPC